MVLQIYSLTAYLFFLLNFRLAVCSCTSDC